jgi:hypothetical protein
VTRGRLAVHAHFYQPRRADPFSGKVPAEPEAAPYHDWNSRIDAECYRPNAERGNLRRISWDLGPTLATWLEAEDPPTYSAFVEAAPGHALAQAYHHSILPLASAADRRTEIRWGIRDFELRFGFAPKGLWLPETAVDLPTLALLAEEGIDYTILAPWQSAETVTDTRRPYRVSLGSGHSMAVVFYDGALSAGVSFEPAATEDAHQFARDRVAPRVARGPFPDGTIPLVLIATDGELYGHHKVFRDLFLEHLVAPSKEEIQARTFDVVDLAEVMTEPIDHEFANARIRERTSWSCHHGVARWSAECPDATDGRWKGPLRAALDRLAGGIDAVCEGLLREAGMGLDFWEARDAYVDVVIGAETGAEFVARCVGAAAAARRARRAHLLELLEAQRWRLAMFASDGWYWEDPIREETAQNLLAAARAVRIVDEVAGTHLERTLVADLELFSSPSRKLDGATLYAMALESVGQPGPA